MFHGAQPEEPTRTDLPGHDDVAEAVEGQQAALGSQYLLSPDQFQPALVRAD